MGGREWGNAKAQGRYEKQAGDSRLRGNDGRGRVGRDGGRDTTGGGVGMTCTPLKSHTRLTNAIRTGRLSIGSACDTLRCIHRSLGFG